jgi:hypothetical protein
MDERPISGPFSTPYFAQVLFEGVQVDTQRVGIAGHSLGGYTALGMAGPSRRGRMLGFKPFWPFPHFCSPYVAKGDLAYLRVLVMFQGGTRDFDVTPTVKRFSGAYDRASAPNYYVELDGRPLRLDGLERALLGCDRYLQCCILRPWLKGQAHPDPLASLTGQPWPGLVNYLKAEAK